MTTTSFRLDESNDIHLTPAILRQLYDAQLGLQSCRRCVGTTTYVCRLIWRQFYGVKLRRQPSVALLQGMHHVCIKKLYFVSTVFHDSSLSSIFIVYIQQLYFVGMMIQRHTYVACNYATDVWRLSMTKNICRRNACTMTYIYFFWSKVYYWFM